MQRHLESPLGQRCVLAGGDDYELCFTAPSAQRTNLQKLSARAGLPLTCIGTIVAGSGCSVRTVEGGIMKIRKAGYDHFL